jgi:hypothetical protein
MTDCEALQEQHRRLRIAAQRVIDQTEYPTPEGEQARVYESQLRDLRRELASEPRPNGLAWMTAS